MLRGRLWITACGLSTALGWAVYSQQPPPEPRPPQPPRSQGGPGSPQATPSSTPLSPQAGRPFTPPPPAPGPRDGFLPPPIPAPAPPAGTRNPAAAPQLPTPRVINPAPPVGPFGIPAVPPPAPLQTRPPELQQTRILAVSGSPYGIGRIEVPLGEPVRDGRLQPLEIWDDENRILYPVSRDIQLDRIPRAADPNQPGLIGRGRLLRRINDLVLNITEGEKPMTVAREVTFLFRGDAPLRVKMSDTDAAGRTELIVTPSVAASPMAHSELLNQWWGGYTAALRRQIESADYPPIVENYLIALLSGRLDLPLPADFAPADEAKKASPWSTISLLLGAEEVRTAILRRAAAGMGDMAAVANLPLPPPPAWSNNPVAAPAGQVEIEPTADRVPPECFYLRFGSFANYLWFRDLSTEFGGDIGRMVLLRSFSDNSAQRVEDQLWLKTSELSRILGNTVIEDQAIIGRDLFLREGASLGILFKARNTFLLKTSLEGDRSKLLKSDPTVKQTNEQIAGQSVSLISTPDNRVRSFLAVDGEYVFVSNSRALVQRFFEVGKSGGSLGKTPEFKLARQLMPVTRDDTVFAYFSPQMLAGLVSPETMIEARRRLESQTDIALLRLARQASIAEGQPLTDIDDLIDTGFLPLGFGARPDGSGLIAVGDTIVDSMRGSPGSMLPIVDAVPTTVTIEEDRWYREIAQYHSQEWREMDPIFAGIKRGTSPDSPTTERLEAHIEIAPWSPEKYGDLAKQLGPPTKVKIDFAPDDIVAAQAHVASDQLGGTIPPHHLFAAIKDADLPNASDFGGLFQTLGVLRELPAYVGAWPYPGVVDRLPLGIGRGQQVAPGMTRLIGGLYRFQGGGFSILSFQREILDASLPHIVADEAPDEAQFRVRAAALQGTRIESWVNKQLYQRAAKGSKSGADLLGLLTRQLKVPRADAAKVAGELLGGSISDSLGGTYVLRPDDRRGNGHPWWVSSTWNGFSPTELPPADYVAPPLRWFRGGSANLKQLADRVIADVTIDVRRAQAPATSTAAPNANAVP